MRAISVGVSTTPGGGFETVRGFGDAGARPASAVGRPAVDCLALGCLAADFLSVDFLAADFLAVDFLSEAFLPAGLIALRARQPSLRFKAWSCRSDKPSSRAMAATVWSVSS